MVQEIGFARCGLGCGILLLAGADGCEMVLLVLQLQPRWLHRTKLQSFLEFWRGLAVGLLGLLLSVFLLLLARPTVLVSGSLLVSVAGRPGRLLFLGLA